MSANRAPAKAGFKLEEKLAGKILSQKLIFPALTTPSAAS
jgi:hypothetical protein